MPVVAGVGGNGATQTATVIIRAIALGELEFSSAWKAIVKQVSVDICIALAAGAVIAVGGTLWKGNPYLGLVLAGAMIFNLGLMAGFAGAVIPLLLKALEVRSRVRLRHHRHRPHRCLRLSLFSRPGDVFPRLFDLARRFRRRVPRFGRLVAARKVPRRLSCRRRQSEKQQAEGDALLRADADHREQIDVAAFAQSKTVQADWDRGKSPHQRINDDAKENGTSKSSARPIDHMHPGLNQMNQQATIGSPAAKARQWVR